MVTDNTTATETEGRYVSDPVIELRDVSVSFDMERGSARVLDTVSLGIERGEILGVVGESGSGKSMFASSILDAVEEPGQLTGEVIYHPENGDPIDVLNLSESELKEIRWEELSMVFQGAMNSFNPTMTIRGHFEETLEVHGRNVEADMEQGRQLLSDLYLDVDRVLDSYAHELSGGMRQRTLIALSLLLKPDVLVMDEPTAALDLLMQRNIIRLIGELADKYDLTIVFITHDLPLIANLADRLAVMYAFEFIEVGPRYEVLKRAAHPYTRALLNATPNLDTPREEMRPIEGSAPDPVDVPQGCTYRPRCPMADEQCNASEPPMLAAGDNHTSKCHYHDQVADEIPLSFQEVTYSE